MTDSEQMPISLSGAVRQRILRCNLEAARQRAHRDASFPEPAAKRGSAYLYDPAALRAYQEAIDGNGTPREFVAETPADAAGQWKPIPGARYYEASHRGKVRSTDRTIDGKFYPGVVLKARLGNKTREGDTQYLMVNIRRDDGSRWTNTVHSFVLLAHVGPPGRGQETRHGPGGPLDNRWPENICYGTKVENEADKPPRPVKPPKQPTPCLNHERCGGFVTRGGKRCHECVVELGVAAAALLEEGARLDTVAEILGYPSAVGLHTLAVKYGGYGARRPPWLRRVIAAVRAWLESGDGE